jgi:transposase
VFVLYAPRRAQCDEHGVVVEYLPWSNGKSPMTTAMMAFLATLARRLSWRETARFFHISWEAVCRSVEWFVEWEHRQLRDVHAIGIDEIHWGKGRRTANFLIVIYQINAGAHRLLWVGPRRTKATLRRELNALGAEVVAGLRFVCSDMWKSYLTVVAQMAGLSLHVVDRFHVVMNLNKAVNQVRREESGRLRGRPLAKRLKKMRWKLLRRGSRVRGRARAKLESLLACRLATARAWNRQETFQHFWTYRSMHWAGGFLDNWCKRAMRSRIEPMKKITRMLRSHEELLLIWFRARGGDFQRCRRRLEQQDPSGHQTLLWLSQLPWHGTRAIPQLCTITRASNQP